ncbi:MAG: L-threonylcarbamoyladenylate synthase [Candidatus Margulisiibacteriota bacterium]
MKYLNLKEVSLTFAVKSAVNILRSGGVIIFPTETVYGIGADFKNKKAVKKIFKLKKRSLSQPLQLLVSDIKQAKKLSKKLSPKVLKIMKNNWPGPLTVVVKKNKNVPNYVTGVKDTVGLRMPDHLLILEIIKTLGHPISASSANISGKKPPKTAKEAAKYFKRGIDLVIDGGRCKIGRASKVVDTTKRGFNILRKL